VIHADRLYGYVAAGLLRHRERLPDLTAATDAVATTRWRRCTFCQGTLTHFAFRVWTGARVVVGVVVCERCQALGEALLVEAVNLMMEARYNPTRFGPHDNGGDGGQCSSDGVAHGSPECGPGTP
jgi:hypothetical protein